MFAENSSTVSDYSLYGITLSILMQGIPDHSLQIHFPCECKVSLLLLVRKCDKGLKDDTNLQEEISVKEEQRRERKAPEKRRDSISAQLLLELLFSERDRNNQFEIRIHSSRMRTVRNSSRLLGGKGVCLVPGGVVSQHALRQTPL